MRDPRHHLELPNELDCLDLHAIRWSTALNAPARLEADITIRAEFATALTLINQPLTWRLPAASPLMGMVLTATIDALRGQPLGHPTRCRVWLRARSPAASGDTNPHLAFYPAASPAAQPANQVLAALLQRLAVVDRARLDLPVTLLTQALETDFAFLCRIAAWHGLVVEAAADLRLRNPREPQRVLTLEPAQIIDQELISCAPGALQGEAPAWDISRAIVDQPGVVTLQPGAACVRAAAERTVAPPPAQGVWPGQHDPAAAERITHSLLTHAGARTPLRWRGRLQPTQDALTADAIAVPGLGELLVTRRTLDYARGDRTGVAWRLALEAIDPAYLPGTAPPAPALRLLPGQICGIADPEHLGRLKVNIAGMPRTGAPSAWTGVWAPFLGAGGVDAAHQAHGPWNPPRELDWVAVWVDAGATTAPLILGALSTRQNTPQALSAEEGQSVLFQEGGLTLRADVKGGRWELRAGDNTLELTANEPGLCVQARNVEITAETLRAAAKVDIQGQLNVK